MAPWEPYPLHLSSPLPRAQRAPSASSLFLGRWRGGREGLWGQARTALLLSRSSDPAGATDPVCGHDLVSEPLSGSGSSAALSQNHSAISVVSRFVPCWLLHGHQTAAALRPSRLHSRLDQEGRGAVSGFSYSYLFHQERESCLVVPVDLTSHRAGHSGHA